MIAKINSDIKARFWTGSPVTGILCVDVECEDNQDILFLDSLIELLRNGVMAVNGLKHTILFEERGRFFITSSGYSNHMKMQIIEEAVAQTKATFHMPVTVNWLLSKPAEGWV